MRLAIKLVVAAVMLGLGWHLIPEGGFSLPEDKFPTAVLAKWEFTGVVGFVLLASAVFTFIKEMIFAYRSRSDHGEWHFCLQGDNLVWKVPTHAHGEEIGFRANLTEISELEYRTTQRHDELDLNEYWIHFHKRESIQLKDFSGIALSSIVAKICDRGVKYNRTIVDG